MGEKNAYYFGCWREAGHYLWKPGMSHAWDDERGGVLPWKRVDGCFAPAERRRPDSSGTRTVNKEAPQGHAALVHDGGWTVIAFWDRSVDKRGGCNSNFFIRGTHPWEDAVRIARHHFPDVWGRLPFEVVLVQEPDGSKAVSAMSIEEKAADYDRLRDRVKELEALLEPRPGPPSPDQASREGSGSEAPSS